jgi:apolipoprotein D and lipocalin family protein
MSFFKVLSLVIILAASINCDFQWGGCPSYKRDMESFDITKYVGKWFEIAREKTTPFQNGDCTTAEYSLNNDGSVKVVNTQLLPNGKKKSGIGKATPTSDPFILQVAFSDTFWGKLFKGDYQVVETDYENYSIVYSCTDLVVGRIEYYWILSRTNHIESDKTVNYLKLFSDKLNVSADKFRFTNQEKDYCGY